MMGSKSREAAARFEERRKREDEAPRLAAEMPKLATLRLTIEERRAGAVGADSKHIRIVVVERAPALFEVRCGDPACDGGGYDFTDALVRELRAGRAEAIIERTCDGVVGNAACGRVARMTANATYK